MKIEIKRWFDAKVLFECKVPDDTEERFRIRFALEVAVKAGASLDCASLDDASLDGARLNGARLNGARLNGARLDGASFDGARLVRASFDGASLVRASFVRARLDGASFDGARLDDARLDGASFVRASLDGASFVRASLDDARLDGARLVCASFDGASLVRASFVRASFVRASLDSASFDGARLDGAIFDGAIFDGAIFVHATGIDWTPVRDDFWAVLSSVPAEVEGLRQALINGKVDGSSYQGECVCLVGTLANLRGANYQNLGLLRLTLLRPAEVFFRRINKGDTPDTNEFSKMALDWLDEWLSNMRAVFGVPA